MYNECRTVDTDLKNQLVSSFNDPYISTLKNVYTGYVKKSTMELITNLYEKYARISSTDVAANNKIIRSPYNVEEPLKSLIKRLNECEDFATSVSELVSDNHIVRITYGLVSETGQYPEDCQAWRNQTKKSWKSFQYHFILVQADIRERQQTSIQGGYGSNNLVWIE